MKLQPETATQALQYKATALGQEWGTCSHTVTYNQITHSHAHTHTHTHAHTHPIDL